jgi:hypothetical protein
MPRKPVIRSLNNYYLVTGKAFPGTQFYISQDGFWSLLERELSLLQKEHSLEIGALTCLPDAFYILVKSPMTNIDRIMFFLMMRMTREIQKLTGRINHIFAGTYRGCLLEDHDFCFIRKYIYQLPLVHNISESLIEYPFSTYVRNSTLGLSRIPCNDELSWIHHIYPQMEEKSISWGITKSKFRFLRHRNSNRHYIKPAQFMTCFTTASVVAP